MAEDFLGRLKDDIQARFQQKYGHVFVNFDQVAQDHEQTARVQFTISDSTGFITRHYGKAGYINNMLFVQTRAI